MCVVCVGFVLSAGTMDFPMKKKNYSQSYRREWELDSNFKGWLSSVPGESTKALCKYCTLTLNAKLSDIKKYLETKKT